MDADLYRIPVGPGALHVERFGHGGTPVVLLHGFGTSSFLWRDVAPRLAVKQQTAYAMDLFGYGESDRPFDGDFGIAAQSEYIERALTALRVPRAVVVGVDVGAAIALRLAATRRERVGRLVLVSPSAYEELPGDDIRDMQRNAARFALRVSRGLFGVSPLLIPLLESGVTDPARMSPRLIGRYLAPFVGRDGVNHLLALARALRPEDLEEVDLADIKAPTMVVWGEADTRLDASVLARLQGTLKDCVLARVDGTGRLVPEEQPARLAELITQFGMTPTPVAG